MNEEELKSISEKLRDRKSTESQQVQDHIQKTAQAAFFEAARRESLVQLQVEQVKALGEIIGVLRGIAGSLEAIARSQEKLSIEWEDHA